MGTGWNKRTRRGAAKHAEVRRRTSRSAWSAHARHGRRRILPGPRGRPRYSESSVNGVLPISWPRRVRPPRVRRGRPHDNLNARHSAESCSSRAPTSTSFYCRPHSTNLPSSSSTLPSPINQKRCSFQGVCSRFASGNYVADVAGPSRVLKVPTTPPTFTHIHHVYRTPRPSRCGRIPHRGPAGDARQGACPLCRGARFDGGLGGPGGAGGRAALQEA